MNNVVNLQTKATFDDFWDVVWNKKEKSTCRHIFRLVTRPGGWDTWAPVKIGGQVIDRMEVHLEATPEEIIEGAKREVKLQMTSDYKMPEHMIWPKTWLMSGGWDND